MTRSCTTATLPGLLEESLARFPDRVAVVDPSGAESTYSELDRRAAALAGFLQSRGVQRGDRVGVVAPKSADVVAALFGIMKLGAVYVPADYSAPAERNSAILTDCEVRAAFLDFRNASILKGTRCADATVVCTDGSIGDGAIPLEEALLSAPLNRRSPTGIDDLAYILYTSGSTGVPKGVMLTHRNALAFIDWCSSVFAPMETDRFSNHAPFHFDLSVLDLYVPIKHGASVHLIGEALGKSPRDLGRFIAERCLTIWYSTPSILSLLAQFGDLGALDFGELRLVLFAGEVFPVKHLRSITNIWSWPVYYNLYGPTETNVCTFAKIPLPVPENRTEPYPIGWPCSHYQPLVLDAEGLPVTEGAEGLLHLAGPGVFQGYWNRPKENAVAFTVRSGERWYNTGDVVRLDPVEGFRYLGRRDRMVKRHGYRIELGEIERVLYQHELLREAAAVALSTAVGVRIVACLSSRTAVRPSIVELKTFCARHLPSYMSPDVFRFFDNLPRTSTDKVDYQQLTREVELS